MAHFCRAKMFVKKRVQGLCPNLRFFGARIVLNPQRGNTQTRLKIARRSGLAKRCELGQLALRPI
jgi:hypothetical protein